MDEVLGAAEPVGVNARLGKVLNRYRNTPDAARRLLASQEPAGDPAPTSAELAAELTADCAQAGLADCAAYLIKASGLKDRETVRAALDRAKAVRSV
ncbi:Clp protease ClpP, partial [Pseudomonas aeruginosa]